jgi:hypothetical protein
MGCYIAIHRGRLARRHYIRRANTEFFWFDFHYEKLKLYQRKYGDDFCLVLFREDDAYVLPYRKIATLFTEEMLDDRGRWIGNVRDGRIYLYPGRRSLSVSNYYNAYHLLGDDVPLQR